MAKAKARWDGKLTPLRWKFKLPELAKAIQYEIDRSFINPSGKLRAEAGKLSNYRASKTGVEISIPLPYARIQEFGGHIPVRYPRRAQVMHWTEGGEEIFAKMAGDFYILPNHYVRDGIQRWLGSRGGVKVEWPD